MKNIFYVFVLLSLSTINAQANSNSNEKTIPIIGTKAFIPIENAALTTLDYATKTSKIGDAKVNEVVELIKSLRKDLCSGLGKNDELKLHLSWDSKAGVFGVSVGMNSGIEIHIKCDK